MLPKYILYPSIINFIAKFLVFKGLNLHFAHDNCLSKYGLFVGPYIYDTT